MSARDWTRPTREMSDMLCRSGATLRAACADRGLPTSGPKRRLVGRLLDAGLTVNEVQHLYGWAARGARSGDPE